MRKPGVQDSATMKLAIVALALLACTAFARDDFRPCASVYSVTGGEAGFSVQVKFERVRAMRCVMRIPITHVPESGTRYGERAGSVCENDGLGCIVLDEPTVVIVDTDIPAYSRELSAPSILPSFDVNDQTVPFMHLPAQFADKIGKQTLPYGTWVSQLFGLNLAELGGRGRAFLKGVIHDMLVSVVSEHSSLISAGDASIAPQFVSHQDTMFPLFSPQEVSDFVMRGARAFSTAATGLEVKHNLPWLNNTVRMKYPFRALSPTYRELMSIDTALVSLVQKLMRDAGMTDGEVFAYFATYSNITFRAYWQHPETLFGGANAQDLLDEDSGGLDTFLFPEADMKVRNPSGKIAGCLRDDEWEAVIGSRVSHWAAPECTDSTQCGVTGVGYNKMDKRMRRAVPFHISSSEPACSVLQPLRAPVEHARIRLGAAVEIANVTVSEVADTFVLSPEDAIQQRWEDEDAETSVSITIVTTPGSVPRLITEPSESIYAMNCFAFRGVAAEEIEIENPYLDAPEHSAPSILTHQRGTLIMPSRDMDTVLGSGCGSMNFGQGFWRHFASRIVDGQFSERDAAPDLLRGTHSSLTHKLEHKAGTVFTAFQQTGDSCVAGARCKQYSPCSLIREEMQWMRHKGRLSMRVPAFNADAPALHAPYPDIPAFPDTSFQQPGQPIVDKFNINAATRQQRVSFGCNPGGGGFPQSLTSHLWEPGRMNMWFGSNRMGSPEARRIHIEDTHMRHYKRISRGVSFDMVVDVPWTQVPHRHVTTNATGCVYLPISTLNASAELACRDVYPALAGTAFANVPGANESAPAQLILVVECLGVSFCPEWNASLATLIDADTGVAVPVNVTTENDFLPYPPAPALRHAESRFRNSSVVGDAFSDGLPFEDLPDYTGPGPVIGRHVVFRFSQDVVSRKYVWEVHGKNVSARALPDFFSREYFAQLFIGSTGVAVSPVRAYNCHSAVDCELRPHVPSECAAPSFAFNTTLKYANVTYYDPCDCDFFDPECQYNCGFMVLLWVIFGIIEVSVIGGTVVYVVWKKKKARVPQPQSG